MLCVEVGQWIWHTKTTIWPRWQAVSYTFKCQKLHTTSIELFCRKIQRKSSLCFMHFDDIKWHKHQSQVTSSVNDYGRNSDEKATNQRCRYESASEVDIGHIRVSSLWFSLRQHTAILEDWPWPLSKEYQNVAFFLRREIEDRRQNESFNTFTDHLE